MTIKEMVAIIRKSPEYCNKSDYAIRKSLGTKGKQATKLQLVNKIKRVPKSLQLPDDIIVEIIGLILLQTTTDHTYSQPKNLRNFWKACCCCKRIFQKFAGDSSAFWKKVYNRAQYGFVLDTPLPPSIVYPLGERLKDYYLLVIIKYTICATNRWNEPYYLADVPNNLLVKIFKEQGISVPRNVSFSDGAVCTVQLICDTAYMISKAEGGEYVGLRKKKYLEISASGEYDEMIKFLLRLLPELHFSQGPYDE